MKKSGFTLIELVMVIVIVGIIASVFSGYITSVSNSWVFLSGQKGIAMSSRAALYKIVREMRRINKNTDISTAQPTLLVFKNVSGSTMTFQQSGTNLLFNGKTLLSNLKNPGGLAFSYLKSDGTTAAASSEISTVRARLVVLKGANGFAIESAANIRAKTL